MSEKLRVLDLFSGIGGFSLGLERTGGFKTVAFCEIEPYCRAVLKKHWPDVPCFEDVRTLTAADVGRVDVICGGFPCQDISVAGKGAGLKGERSGLWKQFFRLIGELRPSFAIVENVAALLGRGHGDILGDLAEIRYDAEWHCIPASGVGAPHERERVWIVAHPQSERHTGSRTNTQSRRSFFEGSNFASLVCKDVWRDPPSSILRMDDGLPNQLGRIRACGNSVVPQIPFILGQAILEAERCQPAKSAP